MPRYLLPLLLLLLTACHGPILNSDPEGTAQRASLPQGAPSPRNSPVKVGDPIPNFTAPDQKGIPVSAAELAVGKGSVILIIPRDDDPAVRPAYNWARNNRQTLGNRGIEVLLLNPHVPEDNTWIAEREELRLAILADPGLYIARGFGVPPGTIWSFVLGPNGRIQLAEPGLPNSSDIITAAEVMPGEKRESIFRF